MARTRNIKPSFFKNEDLAALGSDAMLLFAGLWTLADREGRLEDRPKRIKAEIFPYSVIDIEPLLEGLRKGGFILRYQSDMSRFIALPTWAKHQAPHVKEQASTIPAPDKHCTCTELAPDKHGTCTEQESPCFLASLLPCSLASLTQESGTSPVNVSEKPEPSDWAEPPLIEEIAARIIDRHPHPVKMKQDEFVKAILSKVQPNEFPEDVFTEIEQNHKTLCGLEVEDGGWLNGNIKFKQIPSLRDWVYKSRDSVQAPKPAPIRIVKDWVG